MLVPRPAEGPPGGLRRARGVRTRLPFGHIRHVGGRVFGAMQPRASDPERELDGLGRTRWEQPDHLLEIDAGFLGKVPLGEVAAPDDGDAGRRAPPRHEENSPTSGSAAGGGDVCDHRSR